MYAQIAINECLDGTPVVLPIKIGTVENTLLKGVYNDAWA